MSRPSVIDGESVRNDAEADEKSAPLVARLLARPMANVWHATRHSPNPSAPIRRCVAAACQRLGGEMLDGGRVAPKSAPSSEVVQASVLRAADAVVVAVETDVQSPGCGSLFLRP